MYYCESILGLKRTHDEGNKLEKFGVIAIWCLC